jgi:glycosyltransferase involved in cell wall biosynthesis
LTKRFLGACDRVVTLSSHVSTKLKSWNPATLFHPLYEHFPTGPSSQEARRQLGLSKGDVAHLFFGLIRPYKGLGVLIDALSHLPSHHKLVVAGECYENWSVYQAQIDEHGLQDRVQLHLEFIPDNLVPVFMQACDNVVLPYLDASQSGVTALALHHEKRVVASDVGDLGTSIVPNLTGRLVPPDRPLALAEALSAPWHAQPADQAMAFRAVKDKFSWSAWATQLTQLVQSEAQ